MQLIPGQVRTFSTDGTAFGDILFDHVFEGPVNGATAVLEGIDIQFQRDHGDRHLGHLVFALSTEITGAQGDHVIVRCTCALRDYSGGSPSDDLDGDDPIEGTIYYSIFIV